MTDLSTAAAQRSSEQTTERTARDLIMLQRSAIEAQLAGAMNSASFVRAAISEVSKSPELQQADPTTLLGAIMLAAQLKLEIGPALGHFYLTPRRDNGKWTCLPIIGYKGYIELAYRSGRIGKIETFLIRDGDLFTHGANSERGRFFDWTPKDYDEDREWTGVIGTAHVNGSAQVVWAYLPKPRVLERRPSNWTRGPWKTNEEEMARKTIIRAMAPYLPMSTDLGKALEADEKKVQQIAGTDLVITRPQPEPEAAPEATAGGVS